jgi:hypothetical protein
MKMIQKIILLAFLGIGFFTSCAKDQICIEQPLSGDCICPMVYAPVCGCNGVTYSNACVANCHGITDFEVGECD